MKNDKCIEKWFFFIGFLFPLAWLFGSKQWSCLSSSNNNNKQDVMNPIAEKWKRRCQIASIIFLTTCIVIAVIIMTFKPDAFGLIQTNSSAQTASASDSANRPGVPIKGSDNFGDTVAGIGVYSNP
ncbi:unnamed protein product [Cunninghamella blakesleeana]